MENNITDLITKAEEFSFDLKKEIRQIRDLKDIDLIKIKYIGKKGLFTILLKSLSQLNNDERAKVGKSINKIKKDVEKIITTQKSLLEKKY